MTTKDVSELSVNNLTPQTTGLLRHIVRERKWLDAPLSEILLKEDEVSTGCALSAASYYDEQEEIFRQLKWQPFPDTVLRPISCLVSTFCHYKKLDEVKMKKYSCQMQVLSFDPALHLYLDVSSDVEDFHRYWDYFAQKSHCGVLREWDGSFNETMGPRERTRMSDYDCIILDADYGDLEEDHEDLNALVDILTPRQAFVVAGTMKRLKDLTSNLDCLRKMFWDLGGFTFLPLAQLPTTWRIWCTKNQEKARTNYVEIMHWACLDVVRKRDMSGKTVPHSK